MKTFSVMFIDHKDNLPNHKLIEAETMTEVCKFMEMMGHTIIGIQLQ